MNRAALAAALVLGVGALALLRQGFAAQAPASSWNFSWPSPQLGGLAADLEQAASSTYEAIVSVVTPGPWVPPDRAAPYLELIERTEERHGIPRLMLARLLYQESRFREDIITGQTRSSAGALGIAQFMPATAAELGIDPLDPAQAIPAAGKYLAKLYAITGDWRSALAAYNWGVGNVTRRGLEAAPLETRNYVAQITADIGYA